MNPDPYLNKVRWFTVINTTKEIIPGYACMKFCPGRVRAFGTNNYQRIQTRQAMLVQKPDIDSEDAQDAAIHCFNSPYPIQPGQPGNATQDYPCRALSKSDRNLVFGFSAGPKTGCWYLSNEGDAWRILQHAPGEDVRGGGYWVTPNLNRFAVHASGIVASAPYSYDQDLSTTPAAFPILWSFTGSFVDQENGRLPTAGFTVGTGSRGWPVVAGTTHYLNAGMYGITFGTTAISSATGLSTTATLAGGTSEWVYPLKILRSGDYLLSFNVQVNISEYDSPQKPIEGIEIRLTWYFNGVASTRYSSWTTSKLFDTITAVLTGAVHGETIEITDNKKVASWGNISDAYHTRLVRDDEIRLYASFYGTSPDGVPATTLAGKNILFIYSGHVLVEKVGPVPYLTNFTAPFPL